MWAALPMAVAVAAVLHAFSYSVPAVVLHTAVALRSWGVPPAGPESLELQALHGTLRASPRRATTLEAKRASIARNVPVVLSPTPWGSNRVMPANAGAAVRSGVVLGGVRALRVFWPGGAREDHAVLTFHGGSYVMGFPEFEASYLERLSRRTGAVVYGLDYRLAPEHKMPAAVDDAVAAYLHIVRELRVPPANVIVSGDSAGGGLAALAMQALLRGGLGGEMPRASVLLSPWVDMTGGASRASAAENCYRDIMVGRNRGDPENFGDWVIDAALGDGTARDDPLVSPLFGPLAGLPPTLVLVSRSETLRGDGEAFVERARAAGVAAQLYMPAADLPHVWPVLGVPESVEDTAVIAQWMVRQWNAAAYDTV